MLMNSKFRRYGMYLAMAALVGIGLSVVYAQPAKTPAVETLLPENSVAYFGWDGNDAHREAWEKTAAYEALYKSGLMDALNKLVSGLLAQGNGPDLTILKQGYAKISEKGFSLSVSLPSEPAGPPLPQVTIVLHEAADMEKPLAATIKEAAGGRGGMEFVSRTVSGRKVTSAIIPGSPGVEVGWWSEGRHLVVVGGIDAVNATISVADGKSPNITKNANWKKYRAGKADFEVAFVGWLDAGALRNMFGGMPLPIPSPDPNQPLTLNSALKTLGLDTLGTVACRSGFRGKASWSESTLEAPGPKRGLLAFADQKPMTLDDLPPLPQATNGFYACRLDWTKFYNDATGLARSVAALGPPDIAANVEGVIQSLPDIIGLDLKTELFDPLGDVACIYGDTSQGMFGMGVGIAVKVDDAAALKATLQKLSAMATARTRPKEVQIRKAMKHGREIVTFEIGQGVFNPSYTVDKDWLVIGLFPQTVEAFLLRTDGKLGQWKPTQEHQQGLDLMPKQFTSISVTEPRSSYRSLMGMAPILVPALQAGLREAGIGGGRDAQLPILLSDLPPAEVVARPLFPNISMTTVDENGIRWTSRTSLPTIPLLGTGGGSGAATTAVLVALMLPAVQQAREAARRSHSKNNLKQMGLAMHNYHDTYGNFPQGTHPHEKLKPDKRLSWQAEILPYLDQAPLYEKIDFKKGWEDDANKRFLLTAIPTYQNPQVAVATKSKYGTTHYVGIAGLGKDGPTLKASSKRAGIFAYNRTTKIAEIRDGTVNTMMISEASKNYGPWGAGGNATIRAFTKKPYINGPDGIGSPFRGGMHVLFADGSVRFISENIDATVLESLATMNGGEVIGNF